jgi:hypothetical protein
VWEEEVTEAADPAVLRRWVQAHDGIVEIDPRYVSAALTRDRPRIPARTYYLLPASTLGADRQVVAESPDVAWVAWLIASR